MFTEFVHRAILGTPVDEDEHCVMERVDRHGRTVVTLVDPCDHTVLAEGTVILPPRLRVYSALLRELHRLQDTLVLCDWVAEAEATMFRLLCSSTNVKRRINS